MTKFFKGSKKTYFGVILDTFCPNLGKNEFSLKKGLCKSFKHSDYLPSCKKSKKPNDLSLRKMPN